MSADESNSDHERCAPPVLVGLCSLVLPGLGYLLIRHRARGITIGATILGLFLLGVLIGGVRVIDPPGYGNAGYKVYLTLGTTVGNVPTETRNDPATPEQARRYAEQAADEDAAGRPAARWALAAHPLVEVAGKWSFVAQSLMGPITFALASWSLAVAHPPMSLPHSHARVNEIGTLYTAIAGMLNLMAVIDATHRAARLRGRGA